MNNHRWEEKVSELLARVGAALHHFDEIPMLYSTMAKQQQAIASNSLVADDASLLTQMRAGLETLEDTGQKLHTSLADRNLETFVNALWSVNGDLAHLEVRIDHLPDGKAFALARDLWTAEAQADLLAELASRP